MTIVGDKEAHTVARWSLGGRFLEAFVDRDYAALARTLSPEVRFRALLPAGPMDWDGPDAVADTFRSWFGHADDFEIIDATIGEVGGRLHLSWRLHLRPAPFDIGHGWHIIEQHLFTNGTDTLEALDLLCSGFHAEPERTH